MIRVEVCKLLASKNWIRKRIWFGWYYVVSPNLKGKWVHLQNWHWRLYPVHRIRTHNGLPNWWLKLFRRK